MATVLVGFFLVLSGLIPALTGGYRATLAVSNSGVYYEAYYSHANELAADIWLSTHAAPGSIVQADEFNRRQLITFTGIYARTSLVPAGLPRDSFVYLSDGNAQASSVAFYSGGTLLRHSLPTAFLRDQKDKVYTAGEAAIYK